MSRNMNNTITISDEAVIRIKHLISMRDQPALGIRVVVQSGGCSGLKYKIEYADRVEATDIVTEKDGVKVVIDPKAILYLFGSELHYIEEKLKSGFVFKNPNEKGKCGCGESFSI